MRDRAAVAALIGIFVIVFTIPNLVKALGIDAVLSTKSSLTNDSATGGINVFDNPGKMTPALFCPSTSVVLVPSVVRGDITKLFGFSGFYFANVGYIGGVAHFRSHYEQWISHFGYEFDSQPAFGHPARAISDISNCVVHDDSCFLGIGNQRKDVTDNEFWAMSSDKLIPSEISLFIGDLPQSIAGSLEKESENSDGDGRYGGSAGRELSRLVYNEIEYGFSDDEIAAGASFGLGLLFGGLALGLVITAEASSRARVGTKKQEDAEER